MHSSIPHARALPRPASTPRSVAVLFAFVAAALFLVVGPAAGPALAHSAVVGSSPEDGATVDSGPARVTITFNEPIQPNFPAMTVVGPDGHLWSKGVPIVEGKTVSVPLGELGPAGVYRVAYRVTSADGHVVKGERTFTLTTPGTGTPGPKAGAEQSDEGSGGIPAWVYVAGVVVLFGAVLAFALFGTKLFGGKGKSNR
ncbi:copper resistance CopC family protein [Nocardia paucivorans]|uniref:copper resistance CopC family protein n=1 Tax=Nocardia paucivorans TaxID=114259 RepID=UPI000688F8A5|nr:copper resistance CopC family protein [Nocardia paucivorans]